MSPINFQVLERSGEQWLGLGDPLHSEEDVARRTAYMADKRNADRMLRKNLASLAGFESSYSISRLGSFHMLRSQHFQLIPLVRKFCPGP